MTQVILKKMKLLLLVIFKDQRGTLEESIKKVFDNALNRNYPCAMESNIDMITSLISKNPKLTKPHMQPM